MKTNKPMHILSGAIITLLALSIPETLDAAEPPGILNYQGLVSVDGAAFTGAGLFKFALVDAAGTTTFWSNDGTSGGDNPIAAVSLTVDDGHYSVALGDTSLANMTAAIPAGVFADNADVRLRVWFNDGVNGTQRLSPDQRIASVGYALNAASAESLPDGAVTSAMIADDAISTDQIAEGATFNGTFIGDGSGLTGISGDHLGNHAATQTLDLSGNDIANVATVTATTFIGDGSGLTGISGDDLGDHTATQNIALNDHWLSGDGGNEGVYVTSDGKVGVGIPSLGASVPSQALDVFGKAQLTATNPELLFKGSPDLQTRFASIQTAFAAGVSVPPIGPADQHLSFHVSDNTATGTTRVMDLLGNGNVGIGTTTPTSKLSVSGAADFSGNVGIGTTTPTHPLNIVGSSNALLNSSTIDGSELSAVFRNALNGSGNAVGIGFANSTNPSNIGAAIVHETTGQNTLGKLHFATKSLLGVGNDIPISMTINPVGNVGIGITSPGNRLAVVGGASGANNNAGNYVARITNTSTASGEQGVLVLQMNANATGEDYNWVQFLENGSDTAGAIESNNNGNAQYETGGSDYAELLERLDHDEEITAGDVVGVFGGKISRRTEGADWVMAVSDNAAVLGNAVYDGTEENYETVGFVGQVPVRVRGKVSTGYFIVASGKNDGTAIAVSPQDISPFQSHLIVGRAWEAKETDEPLKVNTVVGLPEAASTTMALARRVEAQQAELTALKSRLSEGDARFASMKSEIESLKEFVATLAASSGSPSAKQVTSR